MYAFILHAHQKIDRVALRHLRRLDIEPSSFPSPREILHFEGNNGPDAPKFKRTIDDQPWHFIDPFDSEDTSLHHIVSEHYDRLVTALKRSDRHRASFEAAWLAHALVDGMTPAHHYPYEEELERLRGDRHGTRVGLRGRALIKGTSARDSLVRNFQLVGPRGLLTAHTVFEAGAYMVLAPSRLRRGMPTADDVAELRKRGLIEYFKHMTREVGAFGMFDAYLEHGWTPKLARQVRRELGPRMVMMVTLAWYAACVEAGLIRAGRP